MPTITLAKLDLIHRLEGICGLDELEEIAFDYGLEYDGLDVVDGQEFVKYEVPANRYDLLCMEGFVRAIRCYRKSEDVPNYRLDPQKPLHEVTVAPECLGWRPYICCAILRNVKLTKSNFGNMIDLQEKLHQNYCRKRSIAAIGVHDLDKIAFPIQYCMQKPQDIKFAPLTHPNETMDAATLLENYQSTHLKHYANLIRSWEMYPVVHDSKGLVSLPPVINSARTLVTLGTRNLFIEVTCTNLNRGNVVLNQLVSSLSEYCATPFTVEPVRVRYPTSAKGNMANQHPESQITPNIDTREMACKLDEICTTTGIEKLDANTTCALLKRMMLSAIPISKDEIRVTIPIIRADIQHACDIAEDVAIAYNYNSILPRKFKRGFCNKTSLVCSKLRFVMTSCGYRESLTPIIDSIRGQFDALGRHDKDSAVYINNSKIPELQVCRTSLLPGLLRSVHARKSAPLPTMLYEVGHVITLCPSAETGAESILKFGAAYSDTRAGLEDLQGILELLLNEFGFYSTYQRWECNLKQTEMPSKFKFEYSLEQTTGWFLLYVVESLAISSSVHDGIELFGITVLECTMVSGKSQLHLYNDTCFTLFRRRHSIRHGSFTSWLPEQMQAASLTVITCTYTKSITNYSFSIEYGCILGGLKYVLSMKLDKGSNDGELVIGSFGPLDGSNGPVYCKVSYETLDCSNSEFSHVWVVKLYETTQGSLEISKLMAALPEDINYSLAGRAGFHHIPMDFTWLEDKSWIPSLSKSPRSLRIKFINLTRRHLVLNQQKTFLDEGKWAEYPRDELLASKGTEFGVRCVGFFGSISGTCTWSIIGKEDTITLSFEQPSIGSLTVIGNSTSTDYAVLVHTLVMREALACVHLVSSSQPVKTGLDIWMARAINPNILPRGFQLYQLPRDAEGSILFESLTSSIVSLPLDAPDVTRSLLRYHQGSLEQGETTELVEFAIKSPRVFYSNLNPTLTRKILLNSLLYLEWGIGDEKFCRLFQPDERIHLRSDCIGGIDDKGVILNSHVISRLHAKNKNAQIDTRPQNTPNVPFFNTLPQAQLLEHANTIFHTVCSGLEPFIDKHLTRRFGADWINVCKIPPGHVWQHPSEQKAKIDIEGTLYLVTVYWIEIFEPVLKESEWLHMLQVVIHINKYAPERSNLLGKPGNGPV
ncbi:bifunctional Phenylalanine--tRNA ligase beta subunit [Babesia duncani]|uniref:phenylalanine--tRNA ligase n=1 Tax=Babesia duncani TaxID=323732 RepID=A0AAD9UP25_9APIC|nr:bifunctional Phenylalanine--tRNA ligase beta subunit [Babesia duncani]